MKKTILILSWFIASQFTVAQTYSGGGGIIPDNGNQGNFLITVNNLPVSGIDTIYGLESVCINIQHPADGELKIQLTSPDGNNIILTENLGYDGDNFQNTCFNDDASQSIYNGNPPYNGSFRPLENVGYLNNGQNGNGLWGLNILDMYPAGNSGVLLSWTLTFSSNPGFPFPFDSTNLPIIMINTFGQTIPDDPKILVGMKIIDNGEGNYNDKDDPPVYDNFAGIEIRGSSSQMFLKKSYGFETWDTMQNSIDTSLLGMPKESDWILNANFSDKTLLRNAMAYQGFSDLGHYATRYRFVELLLNDRYKGVYLFSEKIKRDKNRVDIAKLTSSMNYGDSLTGGYIVKIDKQTGSGGDGWESNFPPPVHPNGQFIWFQYEYPKAEDITSPQKTYIQDYVKSFESALNGPLFADTALGFRKYAVEQSFIDDNG